MIPKFSPVILFGLIYCVKILRREKAVYVCSFAHVGDTFPLGTTSLLEGSSGLQEAYTKACPNSAIEVTATCWCHVMTPCQVSWFSGVFWNYRNKKPSLSIFPAEPRDPDVWISLQSLAWDLEIHWRTHMWFFKQFWCTGACACSSNLNYAH